MEGGGGERERTEVLEKNAVPMLPDTCPRKCCGYNEPHIRIYRHGTVQSTIVLRVVLMKIQVLWDVT
jgi:hypothetical protein